MDLKRKGNGSKDQTKRRKSEHMTVLSGQVTARSHILHSKPESILFELCTEDSAEYIIVDNLDHVMSNDNLLIGRFYLFSNLLPCAVAIQSKNVKCYRMSDCTSWHEVEAPNSKIFHLPSLDQLKNIKGTVSKVDSDFGMCYLNDSVVLIISTCARVALVGMPTVGQTVTVYNAHRVGIRNGMAAYAMCVKSFMDVSSADGLPLSTVIPTVQVSPLMLSLGDDLRGYNLVLWLQDCAIRLKSSFSNDYLSIYGIPESDCDDIRSLLLQNIAKCLLKRFGSQRESTVAEFMACDHNSCCGTLQPEIIPFSLCSLRQLKRELPCLEGEVSENAEEEFWRYDTQKADDLKVLIGVISYKESFRRLIFSDEFNENMPCLILSKSEKIVKGEELAMLRNRVVIVWEHNMVREKFSIHNKPYHCFAVYTETLDIISGLNEEWKDWRNSKDLLGHQDVQQKLNLNGKISSLLSCQAPRRSQTRAGSESQVENKQGVNYLSQLLVLQTKSSFTLFAPESNVRKIRCYLLVSLIGEMVPVKDSSPIDLASRSKNKSNGIFIALSDNLLNASSFMAVGSFYEIRLPFSSEFANLFKSWFGLSSILGLASKLPTVKCVSLPDKCEIHFVRDHLNPNLSLINRDCFGVNRSLEEAAVGELINVVGYIVKRFHQDPKFDREKDDKKVPGFGIPGPKVLALILSDTPVESQTALPITLYLTSWSTLQYPLGLVPGAKAIFRFVMKCKPRDGGQAKVPYLRSSILTLAEVIEVPHDKQRETEGKKELWGSRNLLCNVVRNATRDMMWISVSMAQLHRVTMSANCSSCGHPFAGRCTFVGCSASSNSVLYSQVSFLISEFGAPTTMVFVPNAQVKNLMQVSEKTWRMISLIVASYGHLEFYQYNSTEVDKLPLEQRIFRNFCKKVLNGKRFHLLCRAFNGKEKDVKKVSDLAFLYAVDIEPVSIKVATLKGCDSGQ